MPKPIKRCKCIKDTSVNGVVVGGIYKYRDCGHEKIVWTNETAISYEPLFCNNDYFKEYFSEVEQMAELKKCPFCGGEAKFLKNGAGCFQVYCDNCEVRQYAYAHKDKEEAIESWNNRATEAEIRAQAIDEAVEEMKRWICVTYGLSDVDLKEIDEIAEQLKEE